MERELQIINPKVFFWEKISVACRQLNISLDEDLEYYLVNLLCDFIEPINMGEFIDTPLALKLKQALESSSSDQYKILKGLGDISLYLTGYFKEFLSSKSYDRNYYISMGSNAYYSISRTIMDKHFSSIYLNLGNEFSSLVQILTLISETNQEISTDSGIVNIYEKWLKTGSKNLEEILKKEGIQPSKKRGLTSS